MTVLLHSVLLLFHLLLTVFSKKMRTRRPKKSISLIFPPPPLLPDRATLKMTAALYCTACVCRVMLASSSNHLKHEKTIPFRSQKNQFLQATSMLSRSCFQPAPTPTPHPPLVQRRLLQLLGVWEKRQSERKGDDCHPECETSTPNNSAFITQQACSGPLARCCCFRKRGMRANSRSCHPTYSLLFHTSFVHNHTYMSITQCFQVKALISAGTACKRTRLLNFACETQSNPYEYQTSGVKLTTTNGAGSNAAHVAAAAFPGLQAHANTHNQFHLYVPQIQV